VNRHDVLQHARKLLSEHHIQDADWEAEVLLRDTLKIDRVQLYADPEHLMTPRQEAVFWEKMERRISGEPSAYIVGHREFYGLDFAVGSNVLIPRPETELLVDRVIEIVHDLPSPLIADVGTGCGAIAVSIAINVPTAHIYAIDISSVALEVAKENCLKHNVASAVTLIHGELVKALPEPVDVMVANLPYVKTSDVETVNTNGFEPKLALDGGKDGLGIIRKLCEQAGDMLKPGGTLLLEIGMGQSEAVRMLLQEKFHGGTVSITKDYAKIDRLASVTL
jgi:release factor glutamine methyltransferase